MYGMVWYFHVYILPQLLRGIRWRFQYHEFIQFRIEFGGYLHRWIFVHRFGSDKRSSQICILFSDTHSANLHRLLDGRSHH